MYRLITFLFLVLGVSSSSALAQTTRVVDDDGQGSDASCDAPTAAFATVGAAISAAAAADTVLVCPGTYVENIDFLGKAIVVRSAEGPAETIIDGNAADPVVTFATGETSTAVLEGFTIRNGRAQFSGGGIVIESASPVIRRNVIVGNSACDALGISVSGGAPLIEENTIANNRQTGCSGGMGGGIRVGGASMAIIRRNNISGNIGTLSGGGIGLFSAGAPTIEFNVIQGNSAFQGGGIAIANDASPLIRGNLIVRNEAQAGGGIYWLVPESLPGILLVNNTIADNPSFMASGIFADGFDQSARLWNNIIVAAPGQTAVFCGNFDTSRPTFHSNDVYSATGTAYGGICVDQTGFSGNISVDPLFVDEATHDYHLRSNSPCIEMGNSAASGLPAADLDGHLRVLDADGDTVARVDIGADEAASAGSAPGAFGKISPVNADPGQARSVTLRWGVSPGATSYEYCYDKVDNGVCDGVWTPAWNLTRATLVDLDGGTTYYWQARAINAAGVSFAEGSSGEYWSFTTEVRLLTRIIGLSGNLDFGSIPFENTATRTLIISNSGNADLTVSGIAYPTGFFGSWSGTIAPGGSRSVMVTFAPGAQGGYIGTVRVIADETDGTNSILASGTALPVTRIIGLSGDLAFGSVQVGTSATRTLTISNRGDTALRVGFLGLPDGFSGSWSGSISPGASQTVTITFAPTIATTYNGIISVSSNSTFGSNLLPVTGIGTPASGLQMLWQHLANGSLEAWYVQGDRVTAELPVSIGRVADLNWRVVGAGDLNGDGWPDIVWRHAVDGWVAVWFMYGNAVVSTAWLSIDRVADSNWNIRAVGDVNGDGTADLIWQHVREGWIAAWLMRGSQVISTSYLSINRVADSDWQIAGAGDTNGDRAADIIWQHRTQGWLAVWYLNGAQVIGTQLLSIQRMTDPTWHIRAVGDANGDGRADLLWQNDSRGALGVWFLNGGSVTGTATLSRPRADVSWRVVGPG